MKKSLEKLLDQAFDKSPADVHDSSEKFADMKTKSEAPASEKRSQDLNCTLMMRGRPPLESSGSLLLRWMLPIALQLRLVLCF
ncbi:hypothetical protein QL285_051883 [Trifolium repens]|nr:hypothetical protein QL285_051883 [Trifolium repens]